MAERSRGQTTLKRAGYAALVERYALEVIPNWHLSLVGSNGPHRVDKNGDMIEETYASSYWPGDSLGDHLEFALKYDGTNLAILAVLFQKAEEEEILAFLRSKPGGKYARRLWFLYEMLTDRTLPLDDMKQGNYVDLLAPEEYYTVTPGRRIARQRVNDNLPGNRQFCPMVRRTDILKDFEAADLPGRCRQAVSAYTPEIMKRALGYLYAKETRSSFEIEHIKPNSSRIERFVSLLQLAEQDDFCEKKRLIELQNRIVDERFRDSDYRLTQNYVGEAVVRQTEKIHFISPKPEDLPGLMEGLMDCHKRMEAGAVPAVIHAASIAYGFVFLHPFEDGNGRIHRFLIHNILSLRTFTPEGVMFPISASMLKNPADYDASLEAFSRPLLALVEYSLDEEGRMAVHNDTDIWYRHIDMTPQAESLFRFIERTINTELAAELSFLAHYDRAKTAIQTVVDMPDRRLDLFIRFCLQNNGRLSARRRAEDFVFLSDEEVVRMEQAVQDSYGELDNARPGGIS